MKGRSLLPSDITKRLNAMGLGGRTIYVPLLRKSRSPAEQVVDRMVTTLKAGRVIDFDDYPNVVSLRTLHRCRERANQLVAASLSTRSTRLKRQAQPSQRNGGLK